MIVVVDTSVLIKWFKQEKDTDKALEIRQAYLDEEIEIAIPDLVFYELSNVLRYDQEMTKTSVSEAVNSIRDMDFQVMAPFTEYTDRMIENSMEKDITVYDSAFLTLSEMLNCRTVTADSELAKKGSDRVKLLSDFEIKD